MKKRIILASTVALSIAPALAAQAEEVAWSPRTVEQIQNDVAKSENKTSYTIKYGDTLSTIAEALGVDLNVLANLNKITNIDLIFPETVLTTTVNDNEEVTEVEVYTPQEVGSDVANASVEASVVKEGRGKKVIVYKYKRKTGYHKKNGHRQQYTAVKIEKINA